MAIYHGPNTIENLDTFFLDSVITELKENAPDVMEMLTQLARCGRFDEEGGTNSEQSHVVTLRTTAL